VRREPSLALDGGADGLVLVRRLASDARKILAPGGALAMEIGAASCLCDGDFAREGYAGIGARRDLAGIERRGVRPAGERDGKD